MKDIERLGHYLLANEFIEKDKQKAIFLNVCGSKTYFLLRTLLRPQKTGDKRLEDQQKILTHQSQTLMWNTLSFIVERGGKVEVYMYVAGLVLNDHAADIYSGGSPFRSLWDPSTS